MPLLHEAPEPFDLAAAEALAVDAAGAFSRGLYGLLALAAEAAESERRQLADERARLETDAALLEAERLQLETRAAAIGLPRKDGRESSDSSGSSEPEAPTKLVQCPDSVLAAALSGRCDSADEAGGHVLVDFAPGLIMHALEHFRDAGLAAPERPAGAAASGRQLQDGADLERELRQMLAHYRVRGWVYREPPTDLADDCLRLGRRRYAVLPQAKPSEATVLLDMFDSTVSVPPGWEVLATGDEGFEDVVCSLARHGWGTSLLCVKNSQGGFSSYRTVLYTHGGVAGTRVSGDSKVVKAMDPARGRQFGFSKGMVLSGRLVICSSG